MSKLNIPFGEKYKMVWSSEITDDMIADICDLNEDQLKAILAGKSIDDMSYDECINMVADSEWSYIKSAMNQELKGDLLILADLGLWSGNTTGYKIVSAKNLNEILNNLGRDIKEIEVGFDEHNLIIKGFHHDGTNLMVVREITDDRLKEKYILNLSYPTIKKYTKSLKKIGEEIYNGDRC